MNDTVRPERLRTAAFLAAAAAAVWIFWDTLGWMVHVFRDPKEDMGHAWLVPLFSGYLVWRRRDQLRRAVGAPSGFGLLGVVVCLLLYWVGVRGDQVRLSQFALIGLAWTGPIAVWGRGLARPLLFPAGFLLFMVPMAFLDFFTIRLRLLAAGLSEVLLNGVGIPVVRTGTGLHSLSGAGFNLDVADPCSGLRSVFAMSAISAAYAYVTQRTNWQRWALFLCAIPLAILGNMARIFTIALVAKHFGQDVGTGFYHDYSGYMVFVVAVLLMMQLGGMVERLGASRTAPSPPPPPPAAPRSPSPRGWRSAAIPILVPALLFASGIAMQRLPLPSVEPQGFLPATLPADVGGYRGDQPFFCQNDQCMRTFELGELDPPTPSGRVCRVCSGLLSPVSLGERTVLPADTLILKRNYHGPLGDTYRVTVVVNGESRQSIHRPELCLPAQGFSMERARSSEVPMDGHAPLRIRLVDVRRQAGSGHVTMGQVYWFVSRHHETESHLSRILTSAWDRAIHNRVTRWAMVAITSDVPFDTPERTAQLQRFVAAWYAELRALPPAASAPATP